MFQILVLLSELIRWFARPIILGVRLLANVFCGHLIMAAIRHLCCAMLWAGRG